MFLSQIIRAAEVTNMRGARLMGIEDVLFLLRKDKVSLTSYPDHVHGLGMRLVTNLTLELDIW